MYAVPDKSTEPIKDYSYVYRYTEDGENIAPLVKEEDLKAIDGTTIISVWDLVLDRCNKSKGGEFLGFRDKNKNGAYNFLTNEEIVIKTKQFGTALNKVNGGVINEYFEDDESNLKIVGIWASNRVEWAITDFACNAYGMVTVPLYSSLGYDATIDILKITKMSTICTEECNIEKLVNMKEVVSTLKTIISFDELQDTDKELAKLKNIGLYYFYDLLKVNENDLIKPSPGKSDDVATIIFTSGTTGMPKGAVHTNWSTLAPVIGYVKANNRMNLRSSDALISYLPLAHVYEKVVFTVATYLGCKIGFYGGDVKRLQEDMKELKPTVMIGVPRVFNKMHNEIMKTVASKFAVSQWIFERIIEYKIANLEKTGSVTNGLCDLVLSTARKEFGGEQRVASMGGAAMDVYTLKRLSVILSTPICEGWGMTELGVSFVQRYDDNCKGTIGGPWPCVQYKLRSLSEMNYTVDQDPPTGELLISGPSVMKRYFSNPELTKEAFIGSWLKTGDVARIEKSGAITIIDRIKNMFKLQQGEYVSPEKVENVYQKVDFIQQIFVYGNCTQVSLVAIVVPEVSTVMQWAEKRYQDRGKSFQELVKSEDLKQTILNAMGEIDSVLNGFEKVKDIYLSGEEFTVENRCMTPTFKLVRKYIEDKFSLQLSEMSANNK